MMKKIAILFIGLLMVLTTCKNGLNSEKNGHTYYVNSQTGDDNFSGDSPEKAWKTLQRLEKQIYVAGDIIFLSPESPFHGSLRLSNLSGTMEQPIIITSYSSEKAKIESGDSIALLVQNCKFLKIKNIKVSGSGRLNGNKKNGIEFKHCQFSEIDSVAANGYLYSGIRITGGNNIRITNSYTFDNGFCGINVESGEDKYGEDGTAYKTMKNLYIGYCVAENNPGCPAIKDNHSGNGILVGGVVNGLIEYCEAMNNGWDMSREGNGPVGIWAYMSDSITIQYCYAHHNKTSPKGKDGGGFDFDGGIKHSVMQYNLSAFNEGAGYGIFQYAGATEWSNNVICYNISYNDGSKNGQCGILMWCDPAAVPMFNFHAYNNTIVNNFAYGINFEPGDYKGFLFENNIVLVTVPTKKFIGGNFSQAVFSNNLYFANNQNNQPKEKLDKQAIYADPRLILPENETILVNNRSTINELLNFMLHESSVCKKAGKIIETRRTVDLWGNSIVPDAKPNIGAWQGK